MNVLVTGANGQLGTEIRNASSTRKDKYYFTDAFGADGKAVSVLDITDSLSLKKIMEADNIDVIINCAAYTNVEAAEDNYELADKLNHMAVANLSSAASEYGATLIQISTDYVFHGDSNIPYREDFATDPIGVYGKTKLAGERAVIDSGCKYIILRTAWLYSPYGKNFVKTMLRLTEEKDSLKVVFDQIGTPTYAADLAALICGIISGGKLDRTGIYHFSDEGAISWYDFAKAICELSGHSCDITPCHSDEFPSKAGRPHFSVLDKTKLKSIFDVKVPYWRDSLSKCLKRM